MASLGPTDPATWTWAQHVASHNVKVLELGIEVEEDVDDPMEFPGYVFTCGTLEELKPTVPCIGASPPIRVPRPAEEAAPPPLLRRLWHVEEADSGMPKLEQLELEEYINSVDVYVLNLYDVTLQMATLASYFGLGRQKHRMVGSDTTQQSLGKALFVH